MVLEHQAMAHNLITRMNFVTRQAMHYQESLNRELKQPDGTRWESTTTRIRSAADALVKCLLFAHEAPLKEAVSGTSGFAERFSKASPTDSKGRSFRQFDLQRRMFRYPCSYLVHSESFAKLPPEARTAVKARFDDVLSGRATGPEFAHLTEEDRQAIAEILDETGVWK